MVGMPVKSCRITRDGMNGTDVPSGAGAGHAASARMSASDTCGPVEWRSCISSSTRTVYGSCAVSIPASSQAARAK